MARIPFDNNNHLNAKWSHCIPVNVSGSVGSVSPYDASGNLLCSGTDQVDAKSFGYNEENQLVLMYSEQNNNAYALQSLYSFDSVGQRIRADQYDASGNHQNWREYTYWNGNVLAEKDQSGVWTDYVYGNGRKVAAVSQQQSVLQVSGTYSGGWQGVGYTVAAPSMQNYVFRAGDVLLVRQRKFGTNLNGGILIYGDGIGSYFNDQDGQRADNDSLGAGVWHNRRIPLDGLQGHTFSGLSMGGGTSGNYNFQFATVAVSSEDGTVRTILGGEKEGFSFAGGLSTGTGGSVAVPADGNAVRFYAQDQVGTAQMEVSVAGYPLWKGEFSPFGQQLDQNPSSNRFKFTGKERDQESGLDYFGARYYASSMGRWMSPDWSAKPEAVPYSDLANPQSLNLYGYVNNNPLSQADADGHYFVVSPAMQQQVQQYISTLLRTPQGAATINAIASSNLPVSFGLGTLPSVTNANGSMSITAGTTVPVPGGTPGAIGGANVTLDNSNISTISEAQGKSDFQVGLTAFTHEDQHVTDILGAKTFQGAAAAGAAGDAPTQPGANNTTGGTAEGRAQQIVGALGGAGKTFQPNAQYDGAAAAILKQGAAQQQKAACSGSGGSCPQ